MWGITIYHNRNLPHFGHVHYEYLHHHEEHQRHRSGQRDVVLRHDVAFTPRSHLLELPDDRMQSHSDDDKSLSARYCEIRQVKNKPNQRISPTDLLLALQGKFRHSVSTYHGGTLQQKFNENQRRVLDKFTSVNYTPTHSQVYMKWVEGHSEKYAGL